MPGCVIIITPKNPIKTASHRYLPIFSDKKYIDIIVVKIGAANDMLTTVANGKFLKAINTETIATNPAKHLAICNFGFAVL